MQNIKKSVFTTTNLKLKKVAEIDPRKQSKFTKTQKFKTQYVNTKLKHSLEKKKNPDTNNTITAKQDFKSTTIKMRHK